MQTVGLRGGGGYCGRDGTVAPLVLEEKRRSLPSPFCHQDVVGRVAGDRLGRPEDNISRSPEIPLASVDEHASPEERRAQDRYARSDGDGSCLLRREFRQHIPGRELSPLSPPYPSPPQKELRLQSVKEGTTPMAPSHQRGRLTHSTPAPRSDIAPRTHPQPTLRAPGWETSCSAGS